MNKRFFSTSDSKKLSIQDLLIISCLFSCVLVVVRASITGLVTYAFLLWNLFLAFVPYALTQWLAKRPAIFASKIKFALVIATWILFIPNSFYILTDLFHLDTINSAPKWFDLLMIFSFVWNGLLLGILSVRTIEKITEKVWNKTVAFLILIPVMWLNCFGIYIGRYLRFNSWDVMLQPFTLFRELALLFINPFDNLMEWAMITMYSLFMILFYQTIKKLSESFHIAE